MRSYQCDDFICPKSEPTPVVIDKKISLLYDLCILRALPKQRDTRETALREVLSQYCTETQLDNALHDIICGNKTLNTFLAQKGV